MENASKALLIAASVLIVILLIAVGMKIFNSATPTVDMAETSMTTTEIQMFNEKFTKYIGSNKSKAQATSLLNEVIINNSSSGNNNHIVYVSVNKNGTTNGALFTVKQINDFINGVMYTDNFYNKNTFEIKVGYDSNGYVNLIKIL